MGDTWQSLWCIVFEGYKGTGIANGDMDALGQLAARQRKDVGAARCSRRCSMSTAALSHSFEAIPLPVWQAAAPKQTGLLIVHNPRAVLAREAAVCCTAHARVCEHRSGGDWCPKVGSRPTSREDQGRHAPGHAAVASAPQPNQTKRTPPTSTTRFTDQLLVTQGTSKAVSTVLYGWPPTGKSSSGRCAAAHAASSSSTAASSGCGAIRVEVLSCPTSCCWGLMTAANLCLFSALMPSAQGADSKTLCDAACRSAAVQWCYAC